MGGLGCVGRADTASLSPGAHARPLLPPGGAARPLPQPGGGRAASPARALRCRVAASSPIPLLAPGGRRASQKSPPQEIHPACPNSHFVLPFRLSSLPKFRYHFSASLSASLSVPLWSAASPQLALLASSADRAASNYRLRSSRF